MQFAERKDLAIVFDGDEAPVLNLVVAADDAPHVEPPEAIGIFLVVPQLAERDAQLGGPARIGQIDVRAPLPYGLPAEVDRELVRDGEVGFIAAEVDVEFGHYPVIVVGIESDTAQGTVAGIIAVAGEGLHGFGVLYLS